MPVALAPRSRPWARPRPAPWRSRATPLRRPDRVGDHEAELEEKALADLDERAGLRGLVIDAVLQVCGGAFVGA